MAGAGLQIAGAVVFVIGLVKTHDEFAEKTLRVLAAEQGRKAWNRARDVGRRLLRRPERKAAYGQGAVGFGTAFDARGRVGWGPFPSTTKAALAELERRTQQLLDRLSTETELRQDDLKNVRAELQAIRDELGGTDKRLRNLARRVAIGGLGLEALGFLLVIVGAALQGLGAVVGSG